MKNRFLGTALLPLRNYFELTVQEPLSTLAPVIKKRICLQGNVKGSRAGAQRVSSATLSYDHSSERPRFVGAHGVIAGKASYVG